jgi:predicted MFS family arabinose efflux permease
MQHLEWTHGPLHFRAFRHALVARIVSSGGSWMQAVAAGWLIYRLTGSAAAVGVLTVASRAPGLALSSTGGQLAQTHDPRRVALVLSLLQVIPAMLLAVVSWLGADTEVAIYVLVLTGGVLAALATAPTSWISSHSVPDELRKKAIGESAIAYNLARFIGPLLGGGVVASVGAGWCFAINAATYLVMAWAVWTLPRRSMPHEAQRVRLRAAVRRTLADPLLGVVLVGSLTFAILVAPVEELAPAIAHRHSEGAHVLGFLLGGLAAGGIIGNVLRDWLDRRGVPMDRLLGASLVASAVGLVGVAVAPGVVVAVAAMVCCGVFWEVIFVESLSAMQTAIPTLSGVLTGVFFTATTGGATLGALLVGGLMDVVGIGFGLGIAALAAAIYGTWRIVRPVPSAVPAS